MLDIKLDKIIKAILTNHDISINRTVRIELMSPADSSDLNSPPVFDGKVTVL
jgi:hypothetical protein